MKNPNAALRHWAPRSAVILGLASISLAGCGTSKPKSYQLVPNMSGFLKPGSEALCDNGGPRPCAILIRTMPSISADEINMSVGDPHVSWPLERYGNYPGDEVSVRCYTDKGQTIRPFEGNAASSSWYEIVVPPQYQLNQDLKPLPGQRDMFGWASIEWFNQSSPDPAISKC